MKQPKVAVPVDCEGCGATRLTGHACELCGYPREVSRRHDDDRTDPRNDDCLTRAERNEVTRWRRQETR